MPSEATQLQPWQGQSEVPAAACQFACPDAVTFAAEDAKNNVRLVGYRGDIIKHWYWGKLALDMAGLGFAKKRVPGLIDHNTSKRLTYSETQQLEPEVAISGPFLSNADATQVREDMAGGFPFQASLSVIPEIVEQVADGASVEVNGKKLRGPGAVFRKARIEEISACVFGAFSNTESAAYAADDRQTVTFSLQDKENEMPTKSATPAAAPALTAATLQADHPDLYQEIFQAGVQSETERFVALKGACGDDAELLVQCFAAGKSVTEAQGARIEKLSAANTALTAKLQAAPTKSEPGRAPEDPAVAEFAAQPPAEDAPATFNEATATEDELKAHFAATPALHEEFDTVQAYVKAVEADRG